MNAIAQNQHSSSFVFWQLCLKDWQLHRLPLVGYALFGLGSVLLLSMPTTFMYYSGLVLLISTIVVFGAHLAITVTVNEKVNCTLPFVLSLPVSYMQYSLAKILFSTGTFSVFWLLLVAAVTVVVTSQEHMMNGMLPYYVIIMGELFVAFVLTLAVALMLESSPWTIVVLAVCNVSISIFMFFVASLPAINEHMEKPVAVWNGTALAILAIEAGIIVLLIGVTLYVQSRKSDFL